MRSSCFYLISAFLLLISCGGDDGDAGGGGNNGGDTQTPPSPSMVYLWRLSTVESSGSLGGVRGGDALCQGDTASAGLPSTVSTHRVVLATLSNHPRDYFSNDPPVYRPDGITPITDTWTAFFDRNVTADNGVVPEGNGAYWTGLNDDGSVGENCDDWTSDSTDFSGNVGDGPTKPVTRFSAASIVSCDSDLGLLCVSY